MSLLDAITATALRGLAPKLVALAVLLALQAPASAHELRPAIVAVEIDPSGSVELRVDLNLEARIAGIGAEHADTSASPDAATYERLRGATPDALRAAFRPQSADFIGRLDLRFDGRKSDLALTRVDIPAAGDTSLARVSTLVLTAAAPAGAETMTWAAPVAFGEYVIRVARVGEDKPFFSALLRAGEGSNPIALEGAVRSSTWSGFVSYAALGFEHIVPKGVDHILFVIGLFLLSPRLAVLGRQITAFTLAHSLTLTLGIYGLVQVPAAVVEPLIAASIIFVAVENLFTDRLRRWRPFVVFAFGLLHGLGFAGVLAEIGLPRVQFVTALVGFNIGVELGQLAVVAVCFGVVGLWFRHRHWYRRVIAMPASVAIALVAMFWVVERTV